MVDFINLDKHTSHLSNRGGSGEEKGESYSSPLFYLNAFDGSSTFFQGE